ncbi:MAG: hypothetical protein J1E02_01560 [Coprobacter sp.]|nr:hypothetical protein [Coprobacter sp.]
MKKTRLSSLVLLLGLSTVSLMAQKYIPEDDIYYQPGDKNPIVEQKKKEKEEAEKIHRAIVVNEILDRQERDVDEYNRRSRIYVDSLVQSQDEEAVTYTIKADGNNDNQGYYLNGFTGTQSDFEYAERIRRFYNPRFTIHISDPAYTDIYFLNSNDWNIYIDNSYAWVTPTWTNPWYWNYTWAPYSYTSWSWRWNHGFGLGWYDPFWGHGPHWGYASWGYSPYWGHAPYWGHSYWGPAYGWAGRPGYHQPAPGHGGWNNGPAYRPSNTGRTSGYRGTGNVGTRNGGASTPQVTSRGRTSTPSSTVRSPQTPDSRNTGTGNSGRTAVSSRTTVKAPSSATQKSPQSRTGVSSPSSGRTTAKPSGSGSYGNSGRSGSTTSYGSGSTYNRSSGSSSSGRSGSVSGGTGGTRRGR